MRQLLIEIKKEVKYYIAPNGKSPIEKWLKKLKCSVTKMKIFRRIDRIMLGNYGDYKFVGDGIYELRFSFGAGYRIYFVEEGDAVVILLLGGDKSTQSKDIQLAKSYWSELRRRRRYE